MSEFEGKKFNEMTIVERLRNNLQPQGTAPVVGLRTRGSGMWLNQEFVNKCIDEVERIPAKAMLGEGPSNLEKLAYMLLCDSAYIEQ